MLRFRLDVRHRHRGRIETIFAPFCLHSMQRSQHHHELSSFFLPSFSPHNLAKPTARKFANNGIVFVLWGLVGCKSDHGEGLNLVTNAV